jgi:hypothetical protein
MKRSLLLVFVVSSAVTITSANTALATPPETYHFSESGSEEALVQCDGFDIDLSTAGTRDVTVFRDQAGDVVRFLVRTRAIDTLTNSLTGKTVVNRGVFQEQGTRVKGTDTFTEALVGFRYMGTSPGEGLILQDVGRIVYSPDDEITFLAGQHKVPDGPEAEVLFCSALA